jgi:ubiquinone/menaquinone biosynthesis C-methylase UbiE
MAGVVSFGFHRCPSPCTERQNHVARRKRPFYFASTGLSTAESKYIERTGYLSRYSHERTVRIREGHARAAFPDQAGWLKMLKLQLPRFIPFLVSKCGIEFRGRVLEIGAGGAWLSAELSKLPRVVEIVVTDVSAKLLKEDAPKVFRLLEANTSKIIRVPADFHQLNFPDNSFDFVVSSAVLHDAANIVQALREVKRVLKPGGQYIAIREPVWPLMKIKSRARMMERLLTTGVNERYYTLSNYREFFKQAGLPLEIKRVNLARGFKYFVNAVVNGLTHARYAFIASKPSRPAPLRPSSSSAALPRPGLRPGRKKAGPDRR